MAGSRPELLAASSILLCQVVPGVLQGMLCPSGNGSGAGVPGAVLGVGLALHMGEEGRDARQQGFSSPLTVLGIWLAPFMFMSNRA